MHLLRWGLYPRFLLYNNKSFFDETIAHRWRKGGYFRSQTNQNLGADSGLRRNDIVLKEGK
ncbi:hypothetical protein [Pedobacter arcticus]|uniref:hypothetical protein n=1 Tax=Pedobacter arcticus TaxID=752140 RepID=UPI000301C98A|nr:hypothetical protein [Pedobacter arcticus]